MVIIKNLLLIDSKFFFEFWAQIIDTTNYLYNYLFIKTEASK